MDVQMKQLDSQYDHKYIYELMDEFEKQGWTLVEQNFSTGGAGDKVKSEIKYFTHYYFTR